MKNLIVVIFLLCVSNVFSQTGTWIWMKGDSASVQSPYFGTKGVASPLNKPPGLYECCEWKDKQGNLWIFGGKDYFSVNIWNTLWKYDISLNQWTWMTGSNIPSSAAVYGTKGVFAPNNTPGPKAFGIKCWTDTAGNFWLFGGSNAAAGVYNELWKYNVATNQWAWMHGSITPGDPGNYGVKGVSSPSNTPPSRHESNCTWVINNELWMYGGLNGTLQPYHDLWKYNTLNNEWTWVWGTSTLVNPPNYGTKGVASPSNDPGGRFSYVSFTDTLGNLFLIGASVGSGSSGWSTNLVMDVWKYNISSGLWTWVAGSPFVNYLGKYTSKCNGYINDMPTARFENRACWRVKNGVFFLGGYGNSCICTSSAMFEDLWYFNAITNTFNWIDGKSNVNPNQKPIYGTQGLAGPSNKVGARMGSSAWTDNTGRFWLFGGMIEDTVAMDLYKKNDLWCYTPSQPCINSSVGINESFQNNSSIYPNPVNDLLWIELYGLGSNEITVKVMNVFGIEIKSIQKQLSRNITNVDLSNLSQGIYFVESWLNQKMISRNRILKQ